MEGLRPPGQRWVLPVTLLSGAVLFLWQLGATGLVDETPPLFAASARAMAETGDWLIPRVNGLARYDKPPLVYWLMGLGYLLPGQALWNPLGTWAARLPSALATIGLMLALADTLQRWPQPGRDGRSDPAPGGTALTAALAFALSPLVLLWARIAVSDALFTALVGMSHLVAWRSLAGPGGPRWPLGVVLGLAVLAKGPVAVVLLSLTLVLFATLQGDGAGIWRRLRPVRTLLVTALVAGPWYALALAVEGRPFWDSFFGYHNLQRFTHVVNDHLQPWWYFAPVLVVASLPATPLLLLGLGRAIGPLRVTPPRTVPLPVEASLGRFAACWLLAVFLFFTAAATKLPSYWLPATPAAGLLVALTARGLAGERDPAVRRAWTATLALALLLGLAFLAAPLWVPRIREPELPTLPTELLASGRLPLAALCWGSAAALGCALRKRGGPLPLLGLQIPLILFVPAALLPLWGLGDRLRGLPVRTMAAAAQREARPGEPLAMVGILKPSLHYYSRRVVIYEGNWEGGLVNLADRLARERRPGQEPSTTAERPTVLVVIDHATAERPFWRGLGPQELDRAGLYRLWRVDRSRLEQRAGELARKGWEVSWDRPRPERY